jgi:hypothetical protein
LKAGGRALWSSVVERFELEVPESAILLQAARTKDAVDQLAGVVRREGLLSAGKPHPALVEQRQQSVVLARLVAALRLPDEEDRRPQRRGSRGVYATIRKGWEQDRLRLA